MKNDDGQEQSSLTIGTSSQSLKVNPNETNEGPGKGHSDYQFEYRYMDGVLGYVEP